MKEVINILLVEDDLDFVDIIRTSLRRVTARVHHVNSIDNARSRLEQWDVDVILLDLGLPGSPPAVTLALISELSAYAPVIVLTANRTTELPISTIDGGAQQFIHKPELASGDIPTRLRFEIEAALLRHQRENRSSGILRKLHSLEYQIREGNDERDK